MDDYIYYLFQVHVWARDNGYNGTALATKLILKKELENVKMDFDKVLLDFTRSSDRVHVALQKQRMGE